MSEPGIHTIDMGTPMESLEGLAIIDVLNEIGDVRALAGALVTFTGTHLGATGPVAGMADVEAYACPGGAFLHGIVAGGPNWATGGPTIADAVAAIEDDDARALVGAALEAIGIA